MPMGGTVGEIKHMRAYEFAVQETRLGKNLFPSGGGYLHHKRLDTDNMRLQPLDEKFALWQDHHITDIAYEDEAIGEQFADLMTSGIVDRQTGEPVAVIMWDENGSSPFPDSVEISQVETDPRYRGQGLARYLYRLLRQRHTIVSDQDQTPAGAAMWVNMAREGIPVQGWVEFGTGRGPKELDDITGDQYHYMDQLQQMKARQVPGTDRSPLYVFPVKEQNGRLDTPARTGVRVYQGDYINHWQSGLVAPRG
jgi:GNAT superfamily N-acetyltransferase